MSLFMSRKFQRNRRDLQLIENLESRYLMSASDIIVSPLLTVSKDATASSTVSGYTPAQIKSAYGISSINLSGVTGDGSGQTIAIVDAYSDANITSDLAVFDKEFSLSAPTSFKQVSVTGSTSKLPAANADWDGEISLDVEWAHAIAPKANIVLVDATSDSIKNLMAAVKYASSISTVSVVSMSWGTSEFTGESAYDSYFTTPAGHIGITYVAASGDEGAAGGAEYPAVSPNVLSVGGTTLSITSSGTVSSESAWSDSSGGTSTIEKASAAQSAALGNTYSESPVVSYDANPNTGFAVYDSVTDDGASGWEEVGGTSAGAPQWAALVAIADQGRVAKGSGTLDGATGTLPTIYSIYSNATSYAADFSDITTGSSSLGGGFGGGESGGGGPGGGHGGPFRFGGGYGGRQSSSISATTGYDTLTGVGTPKAAALVSALVGTTVTSAAKVKSTTTAAAIKHAAKVKAADVVVATPTERTNIITSGAQPTLAVSNASSFRSVTITATPVTALVASSFGVDQSATRGVVSDTTLDSATEIIAPLLFSTQSATLAMEDTVHHSNRILANGTPRPIFDTGAFESRPLFTIGSTRSEEAGDRTERSTSATAMITGAALIADGIALAVYHSRKSKATSKRSGISPFSDTAIA